MQSLFYLKTYPKTVTFYNTMQPFLQILYLKNVHACNSIKKQKVTLQTQNDLSLTYIITSFYCSQQKDNVLRIAMI